MTRVIRTKLMPAGTGMAFIPGVILIGEWATEILVKHELRHVDQQKRDGWVLWMLRYVFSIPWRIEYEAEAYAVSVVEKQQAWGVYGTPDAMILHEASNMLRYNAWLFWKPSIETAVSRITAWYNVVKSET
jgi:hypothetical protein